MAKRRAWPLALLLAHRRLWASVVAGMLAYAAMPLVADLERQARLLVSWNVCTLLYLGLVGLMMVRADALQVRQRGLSEDEGEGLVLALVVAAALAVLLAIGSQLAMVRQLHGLSKSLHIGLAALTMLSAWFFTQTLFALHYAQRYYLGRARGQGEVLQFPGTPDPGYSDFMYFSCVIGTSAQTADVAFASSALRRVGVLHCILSFFFNTTLLALMINIAASLF